MPNYSPDGPSCPRCAFQTVRHGIVKRRTSIMQPDVQDGLSGHTCPYCYYFQPDHPVDRTRVHGPWRENEWPAYFWPEEIRQVLWSVPPKNSERGDHD